MGYLTVFKSSITQHPPPNPRTQFSYCLQGIPVFEDLICLHKLAFGKIRFAVKNLTMVLQSENEKLEIVYFKYKFLSCLFISESHIHHSRVQCTLERQLIMSFFELFPNFPIMNPSIPIQALLTCNIKVLLHIKGATKTAYKKRFL